MRSFSFLFKICLKTENLARLQIGFFNSFVFKPFSTSKKLFLRGTQREIRCSYFHSLRNNYHRSTVDFHQNDCVTNNDDGTQWRQYNTRKIPFLTWSSGAQTLAPVSYLPICLPTCPVWGLSPFTSQTVHFDGFEVYTMKQNQNRV